MIKIITIILLSLTFISCSAKHIPVKPNEIAFQGEDTYILFALNYEEKGDYKNAAIVFEELYKKSLKKEYLYRFLTDDLKAGEYKKVITKVDNLSKNSFSDEKLLRYKIKALIKLDRLDSAKKLAVSLAAKTQNADDYLLASDIFIKKKEYDIALKYLDSAYVKNYNEKILDRMAVILYSNLHRKKDAIAYLETDTRINGCSKLICNRLIGIYSHENNINGLLTTYKRLYNVNKSEQVAQKIIQIYAYKREYVKLINFLEESGANDNILLQLYIKGKNYDKAYKLANKLYVKTGDANYLGQGAIYEYETYEKNISKKRVIEIVKKLENVVAQTKNPLYENYLGYILIDREIDVKKGMGYIKDVLKQDPDSAYYLDSLAWGYYKLGECKKADSIFNKVVTLEGGNDSEVLKHINEVKKCLNKTKKVRKRR